MSKKAGKQGVTQHLSPLVWSPVEVMFVFLLLDLSPPQVPKGYVTGDTSIKLNWEVKSPSKGSIFELRWKSDGNESSMLLPGVTGSVTLNHLKVYTGYSFRIRRGFKNGTWGAFSKYTRVWTPEGGRSIFHIQFEIINLHW